MKNRNVTAYRNVFNRQDAKTFNFEDFVKTPEIILDAFNIENGLERLKELRTITDKEDRNVAKRELIPAVDLSASGVLSIDIDGIADKPHIKRMTIDKLRGLSSAFVVMESVSGNIVCFFKYDCSTVEFPFLYYKIYLELTLLLSVNIDFLPEIGRLRYLSAGEIYHVNDDAKILTEVMDVERLPYINTSVAKDQARRIVFGSK